MSLENTGLSYRGRGNACLGADRRSYVAKYRVEYRVRGSAGRSFVARAYGGRPRRIARY